MPYSASATQFLGQVIDNGALRIEAILGAGSFGVVYRAVDTRSGAYYAVKRVKKADYISRETELHKRVSFHPNILTFHLVQIIDALDFCHSRGVYHRDLKPENILVSSQSGDIEVFVADFGLATTNKMTPSSCGTPCYMSPGMHHLINF